MKKNCINSQWCASIPKELLSYHAYQEIIKNTCTLGRQFVQALLPTQEQANSTNPLFHTWIPLQISVIVEQWTALFSNTPPIYTVKQKTCLFAKFEMTRGSVGVGFSLARNFALRIGAPQSGIMSANHFSLGNTCTDWQMLLNLLMMAVCIGMKS